MVFVTLCPSRGLTDIVENVTIFYMIIVKVSTLIHLINHPEQFQHITLDWNYIISQPSSAKNLFTYLKEFIISFYLFYLSAEIGIVE